MAVDEEALLEEIARDPDDERAYLVYADWLQARGDPRGELISIQQALRAGHQDSERVHQQRVLQDNFLRGHEDYFLEGLLARTENCVVPAGWRFGFLERVLFMTRAHGPKAEVLCDALFGLKSARFLRDVLLMGDGLDAVFEWLDQTRLWRHARALDLESNGPLASLPLLSTAAPALSRLSIQSAGIAFANLVLPALTSLRLFGFEAKLEMLEGLPSARWPKLETLTMNYRRWERGSAAVLARSLTPELVPALRHVHLPDHTGSADEPLIALAQSGLLDRLETLEAHGPISSRAAHTLAPHRQRLATLNVHLRTK